MTESSSIYFYFFIYLFFITPLLHHLQFIHIYLLLLHYCIILNLFIYLFIPLLLHYCIILNLFIFIYLFIVTPWLHHLQLSQEVRGVECKQHCICITASVFITPLNPSVSIHFNFIFYCIILNSVPLLSSSATTTPHPQPSHFLNTDAFAAECVSLNARVSVPRRSPSAADLRLLNSVFNYTLSLLMLFHRCCCYRRCCTCCRYSHRCCLLHFYPHRCCSSLFLSSALPKVVSAASAASAAAAALPLLLLLMTLVINAVTIPRRREIFGRRI